MNDENIADFFAYKDQQTKSILGESVDADPTRAARAVQLGQGTGQNPSVIYNDQDNFERELKLAMSDQIIGRNPHLQRYIQDDPIAAKVSSNDWGKLAAHTKQLEDLPRTDEGSAAGILARGAARAALPAVGSLPAVGMGAAMGAAIGAPGGITSLVGAVVGGIAGGFLGGAALSAVQEWVLDQLPNSFVKSIGMDKEQLARDLAQNSTANFVGGLMPNLLTMKLRMPGAPEIPDASRLQKALLNPYGQRVFSGLAQGATEAGQQAVLEDHVHWGHVALATAFGAAWATPNRLGAPLLARGEVMGQNFMNRVVPYIKAGKEPPLGVDPLSDTLKEARAIEDIDHLEQVVKTARTTETHELSPETYARLAGIVTEGRLRISAAAVKQLYGEEVPRSGDGKLGFVSDLSAQLKAAMPGDKVTVPLKDWIAYVPDEVATALREYITVRKGNSSLEEIAVNKAAIDVYHGSPHVFDAWSMDAIGSGEGAASYGHGAYFAEHPAVADDYAKHVFKPGTPAQQRQIAHTFLTAAKGDRAAAIEMLDNEKILGGTGKTAWGETLTDVNAARQILETGGDTGTGRGNLYRMRINADKEQFLDWDKPLAEQHPEVQQKLKALDIEHGPFEQGAAGQYVYRTIASRQPSGLLSGMPQDARASQKLREAGIPGIKYLDQGSRGKDTPGTHNFVVFDEKLIEVTHRNDELIQTVSKAAAMDPKVPTDEPLRPKFTLVHPGEITDPKMLEGNRSVPLAINDAQGNPVGEVLVAIEDGGKNIHVDNIQVEGGPGTLGFSGYRNILRQFKDMFPEAETYSGLKVGGALAKAGDAKPIKYPFSKIQGIEEAFRQGEKRGYIIEQDDGTKMHIIPTEEMNRHEREWSTEFSGLVKRLGGGKVQVRFAKRIEAAAGPAEGFFTAFKNDLPIITLLLDPASLPRATRHEVMHFLREYNIIRPEEWTHFETVAEAEGWIEKHKVDVNYKELVGNREAQLEEAIVHEYSKVFTETQTGRSQAQMIESYGPVAGTALARVMELLKGVKAILREVFGYDPKLADLFVQVEAGQMAQREQQGSRSGSAALSAKQLELPVAGTTRMEERELFLGRGKIGLRADQYDALTENAERVIEGKLNAKEEAVKKEVTQRLTKQWKEDEAFVKAAVDSEVRARPDISADFDLAEAAKAHNTAGLLAKMKLTEAQEAALPKSYVRHKGGVDPDVMAQAKGFKSTGDMVAAIVELQEARKLAGQTPEEFTNTLVNTETERIMREKYGSLEENTLRETQDLVLSDAALRQLHEEAIFFAEKGQLEKPIPMKPFTEAIKNSFGEKQMKNVDVDEALALSGRLGNEARGAMILEKWDEALHRQTQQFIAATNAKEAVRIEKVQEKHGKLVDRYEKREVKITLQPYTNFIHALLQAAGEHTNRTPADIAASIRKDGYASIDAFIEVKKGQGLVIDLPDWIRSGDIKPVAEMTVKEYEQYTQSIKTLDAIGRAEKKVYRKGVQQDDEEVADAIVKNITTLPPRSREKQMRLLTSWADKSDAMLTRVEEIVKDLDLRRDLGPLFDVLIRPMMESKAKAYTLQDNLVKHLNKMKAEAGPEWRATLDRTVPNDFFRRPDGQLFEMTKINLIQVMLNWGNKGNKDKFVHGWAGEAPEGVEQEAHRAGFQDKIQKMIDDNATPDDWKFVRNLAEAFVPLKKEVGDLYHRLTDLEPKFLELGEGEFYFPIILDQWWGKVKTTSASPFAETFYDSTTSNHYLDERTGSIDRVEFTNTLSQLSWRFQQVIHDVAYREAVINANKILNNGRIMTAIRQHYGVEYEKQLHPWLKDIANRYNQDEIAQKPANDFFKGLRLNLAVGALGADLKLLLTPDVGTANPAAIARFLQDREGNVALAHQWSKEIPHMMRALSQDYREVIDAAIDQKGWSGMRADIARWAFLPMAKMSQMFKLVTFVDEFNKAQSRGKSKEDSAIIADSILRQRHGATGLPDLPAIMRGPETMRLLTLFYGFQNSMYNWQRAIPGAMKRGEWNKAGEAAWGAAIVPALFGFGFYNEYQSDDGWFEIMAKTMGTQIASTAPIAREAAALYIEGRASTTSHISLFKAAGSVYSDAMKIDWGAPEMPKDTIKHGFNLVGLGLGVPGMAPGRALQYINDVHDGKEQPQNVLEFSRGIIYGTTKQKPKKWRWWDEVMER